MAKGLLKNKLSLLIVGLILGILTYYGPSIILSILILWSIFSFVAKNSQGNKNALKKIIIVALVLRLIFFAMTLYIVYCANFNVPTYIVKIIGHTVQVVRDFDREIKNGIAIAHYLKGEYGDIPIREVSHHGIGFLHAGAWTQGILNFIFGVSVFNLLLFPLLDLWTVIIIYYLAKLLFDEKVASFSSFIYAIMPSTIVISCTNLRFSLTIFSFLLIALSLVRFAKANNFKPLFLLAIGVILFIIFRGKASKPFLIIFPIILLLALNIKIRIKFMFLALAAVFLVILWFKSAFIQQKSIEILQNVVVSQTGFINEEIGGDYSNYRIYDEIVYRTDIKSVSPMVLIEMLPRSLLKGVIYFMFVPFPWEVTNIARFYFYPQIIFWYFIIPFAILGMFRSLFFKSKEALPILLLCGYFIVLFSLVLGNEGITVRFRELITPFFYIFAGSILCKFLAPPKERDYKAS